MTIMNRTPQLGVALPHAERKFVTDEARRLGITASEFVRRTIRAYGSEGAGALRLVESNILVQGQHQPRVKREAGAA
jgi:hypothetical protein